MLEHYYVKPSTIDRIRASWLGSQIDDYAGWMEANGYSSRTVFRRLPPLFCFAEFAQKRGCTDVASALALVEDFVSEWLVQHGPEAKTSASLRKHAIDVGNATRQMLRLASGDPVRHNRHRRPFPLESEVPGFQEYLRNECGLMESTIHGYRHHLHDFGQYLRKAGITSLGDLSPVLLASFIVECAPGMAPCTRRDLCCHLKVLLRFCHREGITDRDLRGTMAAFPDFWAGRLPHCVFRGLLSVHSRYGLHTCQVTYMTLYTGGFSRFVTSTTAPIATGWSDLAGRDSHPLRNRAFARRTKKNRTVTAFASQLTLRRFYILSAMHTRQGKRWFRTIVLLTVTVTLLLALLIPQPQNHHGTALATILLLPLFLFGIIEIQTASWLPGSLEEPSARPLTCRPSLFQRPPPPLFA